MLLPFVLFALAQNAIQPAPSTADATLPPAGAAFLVTAEGRGAQIYHCASAPGDKFQWIFDAPSATLFQPGTGTMLGMHTTGPTWTWSDGSSVKGTVSANVPASDPANIPSLLLKVVPVSTATGTLARVAWVRRSDTKGGAAPATGCDAGHEGFFNDAATTEIYTFYAASGISAPGVSGVRRR